MASQEPCGSGTIHSGSPGRVAGAGRGGGFLNRTPCRPHNHYGQNFHPQTRVSAKTQWNIRNMYLFHDVRGCFLSEFRATLPNASQSCPQVYQYFMALPSPVQCSHSHFQRLHQRLAIPETGDGLADYNPNGTGLLTEGAASPAAARVR